MTTQYDSNNFNLAIKSVKIAGGEETVRFELKLYINGKFAAHVSNGGTGGPHRWYWESLELKSLFNQHVQYLDSQGKFEYKVEQGDQLIDEMVADFQETKQLKTWCRTQIVIRLVGDEPGQYRTIKGKYSPQVKESLIKRYGNKIEEIINDRFTK